MGRFPQDGRQRAVIENVKPEIDGGRFAVKRTVGEKVAVEADIFADGHDLLSAVLKYRSRKNPDWTEAPMAPLGNDRWRAEFTAGEMGRYLYTIEAWVDRFKTWLSGLGKKIAAGQDVSPDLLLGAELVEKAGKRASAEDRKRLKYHADSLRADAEKKISRNVEEDLVRLMEKYSDRRFATRYEKELAVTVDREKAGFSTWYELFPRSFVNRPGAHGAFKDLEQSLPYVASMGFDVLYLPPIHPIGRAHRKGKNNALAAAPGDPGSPWAIGSDEGGHKSVHPQLGTLEDFKRLVGKAKDNGLEVALDIAFQCAPDHPYVKQHPEWFRKRPDGTVQFAENPPKKYEDIVPLDFESQAWRELWDELKSIVVFWADQGVRIFRLDNPHTKPFRFWDWLVAEIKELYPDAIFLSEAFTRPKIMYRLAKGGLTQSYTYFTWRRTKAELIEYFEELAGTEVAEFFRPNLWTNTPDILMDYLQTGGRPAFLARYVMAATLGANCGVYGPAFELMENRPREAASEEYLNAEKYEIKRWDLEKPDSLKDFIAAVNRIRKENRALQSDRSLRFHAVDNDHILCYSKRTDDGKNAILIVVNLDFRYKQSGWVNLSTDALGLDDRPYEVHDLLTDAKYSWRGARNYVELDPRKLPAHIFRVGAPAAPAGGKPEARAA
ncbi:MAG TPA: alpha-1,4-glucan--maltose-1-phosphate maltosyltransferase [Candidatus Binatia bacterium]